MKSISSARRSERGEGNLGNIIKLLIAGTLAMAAFNAGPVYFADYKFKDRLTEIAGGFPPNKDGDDRARRAVEQAIVDAGLSDVLTIEACSVTSGGGIGGTRTVTCSYDREFRYLPGMKPTVKHFETTASRPMF